MLVRTFASTATLLLGLSFCGTVVAEDPRAFANLRPSDLLRTLNEPLDERDFAEPQPLGKALRHIQETLARRGKILPIWIDQAAFKEDAAEAPDLSEHKVSCRNRGPRPAVGQVLLEFMEQMRGTDATFFLRPGCLEITTIDRSQIRYRLASPVMLQVRNRPLGLILDDLFEQTGVGITADPAIAPRLRQPISATFAEPIALSDALSVLMNAGKVRFVTIGRAVYVTTPERAYRILLEQDFIRRNFSDVIGPTLGRRPAPLMMMANSPE